MKEEQLNFWATGKIDLQKWNKKVHNFETNTVNKLMLTCVACSNGSFGYRMESSKTRRRRLC